MLLRARTASTIRSGPQPAAGLHHPGHIAAPSGHRPLGAASGQPTPRTPRHKHRHTWRPHILLQPPRRTAARRGSHGEPQTRLAAAIAPASPRAPPPTAAPNGRRTGRSFNPFSSLAAALKERPPFRQRSRLSPARGLRADEPHGRPRPQRRLAPRVRRGAGRSAPGANTPPRRGKEGAAARHPSPAPRAGPPPVWRQRRGAAAPPCPPLPASLGIARRAAGERAASAGGCRRCPTERGAAGWRQRGRAAARRQAAACRAAHGGAPHPPAAAAPGPPAEPDRGGRLSPLGTDAPSDAFPCPAPSPQKGSGTMGAKQSSPTAANGRTRAYSGGDLPSSSGGGANGTGGRAAGGRYPHLAAAPHGAPGGSAAAAAAGSAAGTAPRSRSMGGAGAAAARSAQSAFNIPHSSGPYGSQDSVSSTPEDGGRERPAGGGGSAGGPRLVIGSLPAHLSPHLFGGKGGPAGGRRGEGGWGGFGGGLSVPIEAGARTGRWGTAVSPCL